MSDAPEHLLRLSLALAVLGAVLLTTSTPVEAKPRLGLELKLGFAVPLDIPPFNRYVRSSSALQDPDTLGFGAQEGIPFIADATHNTGLSATALATFRDFEFVFSVYNFNWGDSVLRFEGNKSVTRVNTEEIDDSGVVYTELDPTRNVSERIIDSDNLSLITIGGGYRYYLSEGFIETYIPIGGGLVRAQAFNEGEPHWGLHVWAGFTTDLSIGDVAFVFDTRYHFILTGESTGTQQSINNAVVAGEGTLSTLLSSLHFLSIQLGFQYDLY